MLGQRSGLKDDGQAVGPCEARGLRRSHLRVTGQDSARDTKQKSAEPRWP